MDARRRFPAKPFKWLLLGVLFGLGMWYAGDAVIYAFIRERPPEEPWMRTLGSFVHLTVATPLLIAPFQFSRRVRAWWPHWHRRTGRVYLSFAMVAAIGAIYLGVTSSE